MPRYEAYVHIDVLNVLAKTGVHRSRLLHFIENLRANPNTLGNYSDRDFTMRERQIKIVRGYALTYWPDHAAKTVMIVGLKPANK